MPNLGMNEPQWEQYTAHPFDKKVTPLLRTVSCGRLAISAGTKVFELSFSRRINYFEAHQDYFDEWLERLAEDIVEGAHQGEYTPRNIVHYGPATIGEFSWESRGFSIDPQTPVPGSILVHPIDRIPLNDVSGSRLQAVTAAIPVLGLLENCGYDVPTPLQR